MGAPSGRRDAEWTHPDHEQSRPSAIAGVLRRMDAFLRSFLGGTKRPRRSREHGRNGENVSRVSPNTPNDEAETNVGEVLPRRHRLLERCLNESWSRVAGEGPVD